MGRLNYDPSTPMDESSPFRVNTAGVGDAAERERVNSPDFVISDYRRRRDIAKPRKMASDQSKNWMPSSIVNEGIEFRSNKKQQEVNEKRQGKLDMVVQHILDTHKEAAKRFKKAKDYLADLSNDEIEKPSDKTRRAIRIVRKGPPITKEAAKQQAWERVVRYG